MVFVGFVVMSDLLKFGVECVVWRFMRGGVKVIMIFGDVEFIVIVIGRKFGMNVGFVG